MWIISFITLLIETFAHSSKTKEKETDLGSLSLTIPTCTMQLNAPYLRDMLWYVVLLLQS